MGSVRVDPIKIDGLRDLQRALKQADGESQKRLRLVLNKAADLVVDDASSHVPRGPSGNARASLKARSGQREAVAVAGGRKAPYYPWLDFGGRVGRNRSVERRFIKSGRYLYPAWSDNRQKILTLLADEIVEVAKSAGLEVT